MQKRNILTIKIWIFTITYKKVPAEDRRGLNAIKLQSSYKITDKAAEITADAIGGLLYLLM